MAISSATKKRISYTSAFVTLETGYYFTIGSYWSETVNHEKDKMDHMFSEIETIIDKGLNEGFISDKELSVLDRLYVKLEHAINDSESFGVRSYERMAQLRTYRFYIQDFEAGYRNKDLFFDKYADSDAAFCGTIRAFSEISGPNHGIDIQEGTCYRAVSNFRNDGMHKSIDNAFLLNNIGNIFVNAVLIGTVLYSAFRRYAVHKVSN